MISKHKNSIFKKSALHYIICLHKPWNFSQWEASLQFRNEYFRYMIFQQFSIEDYHSFAWMEQLWPMQYIWLCCNLASKSRMCHREWLSYGFWRSLLPRDHKVLHYWYHLLENTMVCNVHFLSSWKNKKYILIHKRINCLFKFRHA